jgi:2-succinyl-5-enolpyruvyl-6-hydroxy-3-cyclohexene-1-carboxylate synthase
MADHAEPGVTGLRCCVTLVDELARCGVDHAVVSPGSRSTPLALALHAHPDIAVHVHLDERSAGFVALGVSRATGAPAVVVTTSGTAAAELHPAIVEAGLAGQPLIALTADRPPELRDVGAPQSIDQNRLFGGSVRWFHDPGVPDAAGAPTWRSLAARVVMEATGPTPGPVHLNLPLREPLLPASLSPGDALPEPEPGRSERRPWHRRLTTDEPEDDLLDALASGLAGRRGVIVAGGDIDDPAAVVELAAVLDFPVIADPRSGCRVPAARTISHADALLRHPPTAQRLAPEVVVRFGGPPASKVLARWLAEVGGWQVAVDSSGRVADPDRVVAAFVHAAPGRVATGIVSRLAGAPSDSAPEGWSASWSQADAVAAEAIRGELAGRDEPTEPGIARDVFASVPDGGELVVSSSMPVRDLEWWSTPREGVRVHANRGANGIDGVISTAVGVALTGARTAVLVGDVAFVHDTNALAGVVARGVDLTIVVVDNDGGGIFSFLPQADQLPTAAFDELFGTPHGVDLQLLAAAHDVITIDVHDPRLVGPTVAASMGEVGVRVVRIRTQRASVARVHAELHAAVATALDRLRA